MICPYHAGPWFGGVTPSRWGSLRLPRHCHILFNFRPGAALTAFFRSL